MNQRTRYVGIGVALGILLIVAFLARLPLIEFNLPCAANWDERHNLLILLNLERKGLNPQVFHYPTLYYYVNLFLFRPVNDWTEVLRQARTLNLLLGCGVGLAAFWLGRHTFSSNTVGLIAAGLSLFSPILTHSATYIVTDIQVSLLTALSIGFMLRFNDHAETGAWCAGMVLCGAAIATKYNAIVLVPLYCLLEYAWGENWSRRGPIHGNLLTRILRTTGPARSIAVASGVLSLALLALWVFFPHEYLLSLTESQQGAESRIDEEDVLFLRSVSQGVLVASVAAAAMAIACLLRPSLERRLGGVRMWAGIAIVAMTFLVGCPYIVVSWREFLFDVGYELKANQFSGGTRAGLGYLEILGRVEGPAVLWAAAIGLLGTVRGNRGALILASFLILAYAPLALSTRAKGLRGNN